MVNRKKSDVVQLSKIRMKEALRAQLARDADRKGVTLNGEIVDRLERSYAKDSQAARDSAIIDMLVRNDDASAKLLRAIADEIAKHPDWSDDEAQREDLIKWLAYAIHGKTPLGEPGEDE
jgi:hypothetical protein